MSLGCPSHGPWTLARHAPSALTIPLPFPACLRTEDSQSCEGDPSQRAGSHTSAQASESPNVLAGLGAGPPSSEEDLGDAEAAGVPGECDGECQPLLPAVHVVSNLLLICCGLETKTPNLPEPCLDYVPMDTE